MSQFPWGLALSTSVAASRLTVRDGTTALVFAIKPQSLTQSKHQHVPQPFSAEDKVPSVTRLPAQNGTVSE